MQITELGAFKKIGPQVTLGANEEVHPQEVGRQSWSTKLLNTQEEADVGEQVKDDLPYRNKRTKVSLRGNTFCWKEKRAPGELEKCGL